MWLRLALFSSCLFAWSHAAHSTTQMAPLLRLVKKVVITTDAEGGSARPEIVAAANRVFVFYLGNIGAGTGRTFNVRVYGKELDGPVASKQLVSTSTEYGSPTDIRIASDGQYLYAFYETNKPTSPTTATTHLWGAKYALNDNVDRIAHTPMPIASSKPMVELQDGGELLDDPAPLLGPKSVFVITRLKDSLAKNGRTVYRVREFNTVDLLKLNEFDLDLSSVADGRGRVTSLLIHSNAIYIALATTVSDEGIIETNDDGAKSDLIVVRMTLNWTFDPAADVKIISAEPNDRENYVTGLKTDGRYYYLTHKQAVNSPPSGEQIAWIKIYDKEFNLVHKEKVKGVLWGPEGGEIRPSLELMGNYILSGQSAGLGLGKGNAEVYMYENLLFSTTSSTTSTTASSTVTTSSAASSSTTFGTSTTTTSTTTTTQQPLAPVNYAIETVETWVPAPNGNRLYTRIVQAVPTLYPGWRFPALIVIPGGTGAGAPMAGNIAYRNLAASGFVIVAFNVEGRGTGVPGNLISQGTEDCNGFVHQDDAKAIIEYTAALPNVNASNIGVETSSFGIAIGAGALGRYPTLPVAYLADQEGPHDNRVITFYDAGHETRVCGHWSTVTDPSPGNVAFWAEREAVRYIGNYPGRYLRMQAEADHAQNPRYFRHAIEMINAATRPEYGGAGSAIWTRMNGSDMGNPVNRAYPLGNSSQYPKWIAGRLSDHPGLNIAYDQEMAALATTGSALYFPRIVNTGSLFTGLAIVNPGQAAAGVTFTAFENSGAVIGSSAGGTAVLANPSIRTMAPRSQIAEVAFQIFGDSLNTAGSWAKVSSSQPGLTGFYLTFDGALNTLDGAEVSDRLLQDFILGEVQNAEISLVNPNNQQATAAISLVNSQGQVRDRQSIQIPANGRYSNLVARMFDSGQVAETAFLSVTSSLGLAATELFGVANRWTAALNALDAGGGSRQLYSPQYVFVDGTWKTMLKLINLESAPTTVSLQLFDDAGTQRGQGATLNLPAKGSGTIADPRMFGVSPPLEGYVRFSSSTSRVAGYARFGDPTDTQFQTALPLLSAGLNEAIFSQVAQNEEYFTGLAILNINSEPAHVSVRVFDAAGEQVGTATLLIAAHARVSKLLSQIVPALPPMNKGYFRVSSDKPVISSAVFGTNTLSALSALLPQPL